MKTFMKGRLNRQEWQTSQVAIIIMRIQYSVNRALDLKNNNRLLRIDELFTDKVFKWNLEFDTKNYS